ncbi:MAG: squalene--hopene cyclase [Burkholderiales bacterium]|nr:squalene--hopene cyclase [Burkholderiales bacterium]
MWDRFTESLLPPSGNALADEPLSYVPAAPARRSARSTDYATSTPFIAELKHGIRDARRALLGLQKPDGHWCFELEADCTIPAEYILMMHFMDEIDAALERKIAVYLRARQSAAHDGWSLYPGAAFDMSCSVKAYYALKLAGDDVDSAPMIRARAAILANGGAARCNVFTRIALALFEQVPWRAAPLVPVEIMLLPRWFPFHPGKVSYWSRTVMIPLSILCSLKARAKNPRGISIAELFTIPPEQENNYFPVRSALNRALLGIERIAFRFERFVPARVRARAIAKAEQWIIERLNGEDGLGAIFPAMVNAYEALALLGYGPENLHRATAKRALEKLLVVGEESAYCQPCVSPVWDTALACLALQEADGDGKSASSPSRVKVRRALDWLTARQLDSEPGDWQHARPALRGGGWPFQYGNDHYPDVDDTAAVGWAMQRAHDPRYAKPLQRAAQWVAGMQSKNGGFAAFDVDNTHYHLNEIPFADHGALLDPPSADVSARCIAFLGLNDAAFYADRISSAASYLCSEQESCGAWFGRWGTNYIYGTWSVLTALEAAGVLFDSQAVASAVQWLKRVQRDDGGWGESNDSYLDDAVPGTHANSTAFQTAWAMLALMAAGEAGSEAVARGAAYLLRAQRDDGLWRDDEFTAPGFPRVFYLKYHGYDKYFPLWALARYRHLLPAEDRIAAGDKPALQAQTMLVDCS